MLKDLNIWFAKKNNNNMFLAGALLVLWILLNPVMIFAQEQTEVNEGVLEEEFVIDGELIKVYPPEAPDLWTDKDR